MKHVQDAIHETLGQSDYRLVARPDGSVWLENCCNAMRPEVAGELLEALKDAAAHMEAAECDPAHIASARAAIAKAEGRVS